LCASSGYHLKKNTCQNICTTGLYTQNSLTVEKTQHQNPEFGPKPGEIQNKKDLQKSTLAFKGGRIETQKGTIFLVVN
jgi:hypothetical protein